MPGELVGTSTTDTAEQVAAAMGVTLDETPPPVADPAPAAPTGDATPVEPVAPAAPLPDAASAAQPDEDDDAPGATAKPGQTQKRIQWLNAKRREAEQRHAIAQGRIEELARQLEDARRGPAAPLTPAQAAEATHAAGFPQLPPEPKEDDFDTLAGYHKALIEWNFKKLQSGTGNVEQIVQQRMAEEQQKLATATAQQQFQAAMTGVYAAGRQQFQDFDQVLQDAAERGLQFAPPVLHVIFTHPKGAEIAYALSADLDTAAYIQAAPTEGLMTRQLDRYVTEALKIEGGAYPNLQAPWQRPKPAAPAAPSQQVSPLQPVAPAAPAAPAPPIAPTRVVFPASAATAPVSPLGESASAQPQTANDDGLDYQAYKRARIREGAFDIRARPGARTA